MPLDPPFALPFDIFASLLGLTTGLLGWRLWQVSRLRAAPEPVPASDVANAHWSDFLVNMSHELRTPLNGVIGFTEMLLEADLPDDQQRQVRLIAESGRAMLRLLNDILDIARIEAGQLRLVPEPVDLRDELEQCLGLMQPIAATRGLALRLDAAQGLPKTLSVDRLHLRQVLLGLIGNALKFTRQGQVRLLAWPAGDKVCLAVADSGIGIAPERHATLFTPFTGGADGARPYSGTGLGLAMAERVVRLMGGTIAVDSTPGKGSTFTVTLPHIQAIAAPAPTPEPLKKQPALEGLRVLIAEDHAINQQLIMAMAVNLGLAATLVSNGREAVEAVLRAEQQNAPFQLVLMDVQMPEMDGLEAARTLREAGCSPSDLPIIALTANCYAEDIAAARAAGMQAHLAKPIMLADLARALAELRPASVTDSVDTTRDLLRRPEGISTAIHALDHRYRQRKQALTHRIEQALAEDPDCADWAGIASGLHRLAGVAANFGDARLGELSRQLEQQLQEASLAEQRQRLLAARWAEWQDAA